MLFQQYSAQSYTYNLENKKCVFNCLISPQIWARINNSPLREQVVLFLSEPI